MSRIVNELSNEKFNQIIDRNEIRPLVKALIDLNIYCKSSNFAETDLKSLKDKFTCRELVEFLEKNNLITFYKREEWLNVRYESTETFIFISNYYLRRLIDLNQKTPIQLVFLNMIRWYESIRWTDYTKTRAFFEFHLSNGGNLKIVPTSYTYIYTERKQEFYTTFEAVKAAGELYEGTKFIKFEKRKKEKDNKYILDGLKLEETLNSMDDEDIYKNHFNIILKDLKVDFNPKPHQFWHGTAPFCDGNPGDCEEVAGKFYKSVPKDQITAKDRESYGSSCWGGDKVLCRFDPDAAVRSGIFQRAGVDPHTMNFEMKWFGTAPFCDPIECEVWSEGFMPVHTDDYGDGSKCWTGRKILGIRPLSMTIDQQKNFEEQRKKCGEVMVMESQKQKDMLKGIFETGAKVLGAL
jgi:hypothetical protein